MKKLIIASLALTCTYGWANEITFIHTKNQAMQWIKLMPIDLPTNSTKKITQTLEQRPMALSAMSTGETSSVHLDMNNVPVLNQGMHGTCATFAVTAALDALIGKGDYISQTCNLTLGQYLSTHTYQLSGWDGGFPDQILAQINSHGIVSKSNEQQQGCAGLKEYPTLNSTDPSNEMTIDEFHQLSEQVSDLKDYDITHLLDFFEFVKREKNPADIIKNLKLTLSKGDRIILGTIVTTADGIGAYGQYHESEDTWLITSEVISAIKSKQYGAHALIITGYDDNAVATDIHGTKHKGLFILRNSWGENAGDKGNYYMSYDYMANLGFEQIRIRALS